LIHEKTGAYNPNIIVISANIIDFIPLRRWPEHNFLELANRLAKTYPDFYILFVGLEVERMLTEDLLVGATSSKILSLVGETKDLSELITLFTLGDLLITSDSGPAHFACLSDINILTLFGPETPRLFSPLVENSWSIGEQVECSPCFSIYNGCHTKCKNNRCLQAISVDQVEEEACLILNSRVIAQPTKEKKLMG
jgi:ADP-heptose:LPS heptosyltransferase